MYDIQVSFYFTAYLGSGRTNVGLPPCVIFVAYVIGYPIVLLILPFPYSLPVITGWPITLFLYNDGSIKSVADKHTFGKMFIGTTFLMNIFVPLLLLRGITSDGG